MRGSSDCCPRRVARAIRPSVWRWWSRRWCSGGDAPWPTCSRSRSRAPESERLEEERLVAGEERLDALLALGRHDEAVGPLQALVAAQPLRERPRRLLMLALYRSGRQAEALAVFAEARTTLRDELGLEPSAELRELQAAILRQDDQLGAPRGACRKRPSRRAGAQRYRAGAG